MFTLIGTIKCENVEILKLCLFLIQFYFKFLCILSYPLTLLHLPTIQFHFLPVSFKPKKASFKFSAKPKLCEMCVGSFKQEPRDGSITKLDGISGTLVGDDGLIAFLLLFCFNIF